MKVGISISIDVTKILKERLFTGAKGTYMDLTTFVDLDGVDKFGNNGFISQSHTKEEREAKAPHTPILGNVKVFYRDDAQQRGQEYQQGSNQARAAAGPDTTMALPKDGFADLESDIPF
jgi:hypothetical protein